MDKLNELKEWIMDLDKKKKIAIAAGIAILIFIIVAS